MIRIIKDSLTIKICLLVGILLVAASGITYGAVARFLPAYYSSQLEENLDAISKEMAETISSHKSIEDAGNVIELFEAGSQVQVVILDEEGVVAWPLMDAVAEETAVSDSSISDGYEADENWYEGESETFSQSAEVAEDTEISEDTETLEDTETSEVIETAENMTEKEYAETDGGQSGVEELLNENTSNSAVKHYDLKIGGQQYTMLVSGGMQPVNQAMGILKQIFPYILGVSILIAILFALAASLYLTAPVVRLSQISRKMAALDFTGAYQGRRTDEIGILGRNLNEMSENLSRSLGELQEANAKLKSDIELEREIEQKRIAFFSAVSHELKTPITILKGHLSGMLQGVGAYRDRDYYLRRSEETAEKMEDMVQELLTVSRIESRIFTLQETDIAEQLRLQLAELTEWMEEKKLELAVEMPEHLNVQVNPSMMEKVFRNLLVNAIRYTPEGEGNQIRVILKDGFSQEKRMICSVENTGVHIQEDALPHLFEAFYRVEQSRNRQTGGSGLGLYIVKMVLDQHGAKYRIENTKEGVRFFFSF
ncbi:MAG: HAMP domain-containing sensor histidine kinase [Eubacteriales bacterium]|nr:HAMP domain-containing sensor histidine kinase [Eubacteriales bacterium]